MGFLLDLFSLPAGFSFFGAGGSVWVVFISGNSFADSFGWFFAN